MSHYLEALARAQHRQDQVRRALPPSPIGRPVQALSEIADDVAAIRDAISLAKADVEQAVAERERVGTALGKASETVNSMHARAAEGELLDSKQLHQNIESVESLKQEATTIEAALDFRQRRLKETANKLIPYAAVIPWLKLAEAQRSANLAIERCILAEDRREFEIDRFLTTRMLFSEARNYADAADLLSKSGV